ncbi:hypothetical protein GB928_018810 [Shinella curvata]|uniref:Uncharacterized protein n=1 Tax=Shinella curvata TaxID=1817964 RepID=A0ABT8XIS6_9HYPH|nr:hypothetical protein [Shinella curvata]MCJ8053912.1 hypothetical protein [Shinella curvata]MDO6123244.1 hypothetical protein [Shinella curvata]
MDTNEFTDWANDQVGAIENSDDWCDVREQIERIVFKAFLLGQGAPRSIIDVVGEYAADMARMREDLSVARRFADTGGSLSTIADAVTRLHDRVDKIQSDLAGVAAAQSASAADGSQARTLIAEVASIRDHLNKIDMSAWLEKR